MRFLSLWTLLLCPALAHAADLARIDRTIKKEPAYKGKPSYCLLVFGPEAKSRAWLVLDGDTLYVDRNCNGDLTEDGERVKGEEKRQIIVSPDGIPPREARLWKFDLGKVREGKLRYGALVVAVRRLDGIPKKGSPRAEDATLVTLKLEGKGQQSASGNFSFTPRRQGAPVLHFNGPLTMANPFEGQVLVRGQTGRELRTVIGTPGLGKRTFAFPSTEAVPADLHPIVEVEFPAASADARPVRARFTLDHRC